MLNQATVQALSAIIQIDGTVKVYILSSFYTSTSNCKRSDDLRVM